MSRLSLGKLGAGGRLVWPSLSRVGQLFSDPEASRWKKLLVVLVIGYVLLPADLVPDFIPIWGWLDDAGVLTAAMLYLSWALRPYTASNARHYESPR